MKYILPFCFSGFPGPRGLPGIDAHPGEKGIPGLIGFPGIPGQKGLSGDQGPFGYRGPNGVSGKKGMIKWWNFTVVCVHVTIASNLISNVLMPSWILRSIVCFRYRELQQSTRPYSLRMWLSANICIHMWMHFYRSERRARADGSPWYNGFEGKQRTSRA